MTLNRKTAAPLFLIASVLLLPAIASATGTERMIGNWKYSCTDDGVCNAFVGVGNTQETVLGWTIHKSEATGEINSIIRVPLGVILQAGVRVYTADDSFFSLNYQICLQDGCSATVVMDSAIRTKLIAADTARIVFFAQTPGEEPKGASFEISVKGVADVFQMLDENLD